VSFGKIRLRLNLRKVYLKDRILSISNLILLVAQKNVLSAQKIVRFLSSTYLGEKYFLFYIIPNLCSVLRIGYSQGPWPSVSEIINYNCKTPFWHEN
jgi:hypothetical protein